MLRFIRTASLGLLALSVTAGAAVGDDLADVNAGIAAATKSTTSYVVDFTYLAMPAMATKMTVVRDPGGTTGRIHASMQYGATTIESYSVDGAAFVELPGMGWRKISLSSPAVKQTVTDMLGMVQGAQYAILPDRIENGTSVGVVAVNFAHASEISVAGQTTPIPQHTECTYDKATYRFQTCSNTQLRMTFSHYNDPANVVVLPAAAKNAVPLVIPKTNGNVRIVPAPAAPPAPATSPLAPQPADPGAGATPAPAASSMPSADSATPTP